MFVHHGCLAILLALCCQLNSVSCLNLRLQKWLSPSLRFIRRFKNIPQLIILKNSPLNHQPISIEGPYFQGWLLRTVDHNKNISIIAIIGSFSSPGSAKYTEHYIFVGGNVGEQHFQHTAFPSPDGVVIGCGVGSSTSASQVASPALNISWSSRDNGYFVFTDE